ncbi:GntR family transcriptional regulator [Streptomyces luteolifulvus]|jgi:DNA-binding GntR family transcriptional regulator|uniref:GntR family transcriptional regulator n=1 Tax=Streptomyces luteolifulvus TaxID=2615112 RepID=A0A6H9UPE0_9ACTN|nr:MULTISPECIES: GntR family transcriptional regulator [Streptomyces]KAB1139893.1 GntR family transcriptional regulator [Streptomyces luteolifulvus]MXM67408.1 GntR family transcriptional regulator [Streptomyces sp. HUCO-GS316]
MAEQPLRESTYLRLARELRAAILRHDYPEGVRLPTEAELAAHHQVSRQTVRRAFQDLVAEGLVHRVPGRGTFATPRDEQYLRQFGSVDDLMGLSIDTRMDLVAPLHRRVDVDAAGRLGLHTDQVHKLAFLRRHEETAFCHTAVFLPPAVGRLLESVPELTEAGAPSAFTVIGLLDQRLPEPIDEAEQSITVAEATPEIAGHLGCAPGRALLRVDRVYQSVAGQLVELAISHFLPEHYSYRVRLKRSGH